jgi:hypothetical protein
VDEWLIGEVRRLRADIGALCEAAEPSLRDEMRTVARWFETVENIARQPTGQWVQNTLPCMHDHVSAIAGRNLIDLTPGLAARWLLVGTKPPTGSHVVTIEKFAQAMRAGQWRSGGFITVGRYGELRDGCHRCHAVIASGVSIRVHVLCSGPVR